MKTIILLVILASTNASAKSLTDDELMMIGTCVMLILQQKHFDENQELGGKEFLKSFWEQTAKLFGRSIDQFVTDCYKTVSMQIAKDSAEKPI